MKRILYVSGFAIVLVSCSNATDGSAQTDTTTMPVDTVMQNNAGMDTSTTINSNTGSQSTTDTAGMRKPDINAPTGTDPKSRKTTQGAERSQDSVSQQRQ